ncbi:MAG: polyphosphate--glucose phosphotransferase [Acidimicrobiia bacterium]
MSHIRLGIDIGGSAIKGALVDLEGGSLVGDRLRIETPEPGTPERIGDAVASLVGDLDYAGPIGIGFPAVVTNDVISTASNIDGSWVGVDAGELFRSKTGSEVAIVNDADAAALCEARYGVARGVSGLVIVLTFGSGIGSGLLVNGELVRNVELGGLELEGHARAEYHFSARSRKLEGLSWDEWGARANRYLAHVNSVFAPQLIAIGGGISRKWDRWDSKIDTSLPVVPAEFANNAGIVGAATLVD